MSSPLGSRLETVYPPVEVVANEESSVIPLEYMDRPAGSFTVLKQEAVYQDLVGTVRQYTVHAIPARQKPIRAMEGH